MNIVNFNDGRSVHCAYLCYTISNPGAAQGMDMPKSSGDIMGFSRRARRVIQWDICLTNDLNQADNVGV